MIEREAVRRVLGEATAVRVLTCSSQQVICQQKHTGKQNCIGLYGSNAFIDASPNRAAQITYEKSRFKAWQVNQVQVKAGSGLLSETHSIHLPIRLQW